MKKHEISYKKKMKKVSRKYDDYEKSREFRKLSLGEQMQYHHGFAEGIKFCRDIDKI